MGTLKPRHQRVILASGLIARNRLRTSTPHLKPLPLLCSRLLILRSSSLTERRIRIERSLALIYLFTFWKLLDWRGSIRLQITHRTEIMMVIRLLRFQFILSQMLRLLQPSPYPPLNDLVTGTNSQL